jgi:excisionase family DNA binding protein
MANEQTPIRYRSLDEMPLVLTAQEASAALGLGQNAAYSLVKAGRLEAIRSGDRILITKEALKRFLNLE